MGAVLLGSLRQSCWVRQIPTSSARDPAMGAGRVCHRVSRGRGAVVVWMLGCWMSLALVGTRGEASDCAGYTSCESCQGDAACGWCASLGGSLCLAGNATAAPLACAAGLWHWASCASDGVDWFVVPSGGNTTASSCPVEAPCSLGHALQSARAGDGVVLLDRIAGALHNANRAAQTLSQAADGSVLGGSSDSVSLFTLEASPGDGDLGSRNVSLRGASLSVVLCPLAPLLGTGGLIWRSGAGAARLVGPLTLTGSCVNGSGGAGWVNQTVPLVRVQGAGTAVTLGGGGLRVRNVALLVNSTQSESDASASLVACGGVAHVSQGGLLVVAEVDVESVSVGAGVPGAVVTGGGAFCARGTGTQLYLQGNVRVAAASAMAPGSAGGAVLCEGGATCVVQGNVSFARCAAPAGQGGAVATRRNAAELEVLGGPSFVQCTAAFGGGAIAVIDTDATSSAAADVSILGATFSSCGSSVNGGGAIWAENIAGVVVQSCDFVGCYTNSTLSAGGAGGGAIRGSAAPGFFIDDSTFTGCSARMEGGAISFELDSPDVRITSSNFTRCRSGSTGIASTSDGGAIRFGWRCFRAAVWDCMFVNNSALRSGAGVHLNYYNYNSTVLRCTFLGGSSGQDAGGLGWEQDNAGSLCADSFFRDNSALYRGGGLSILVRNAGCTIRNCVMENNWAKQGGGLAMFGMANNLLVDGLVARNNRALWWGGSVSMGFQNYNVHFVNCTISDSYAPLFGGGLYMGEDCSGTMLSHCEVTDNRCDGEGGGIYSSVANDGLLLQSCQVTGNRAMLNGGGILIGISHENISFVDCTISHNDADACGGAITVREINTGVVLHNVTLTDNRAVKEGGGVYADVMNSIAFEAGCLVARNWAGNGGAVSVSLSSNITIDEGHFDHNGCNGSGGALYLFRECRAVLTRSTFSNNTAALGGVLFIDELNSAGAVRADLCDMRNNSALVQGGAIQIAADLFLSRTTLVGNVAPRGAAIMVPRGNMTIFRGSVWNNACTRSDQLSDAGYSNTLCGAIELGQGAFVNVTGSDLRANKWSSIDFVAGATLSLWNSTLSLMGDNTCYNIISDRASDSALSIDFLTTVRGIYPNVPEILCTSADTNSSWCSIRKPQATKDQQSADDFVRDTEFVMPLIDVTGLKTTVGVSCRYRTDPPLDPSDPLGYVVVTAHLPAPNIVQCHGDRIAASPRQLYFRVSGDGHSWSLQEVAFSLIYDPLLVGVIVCVAVIVLAALLLAIFFFVKLVLLRRATDIQLKSWTSRTISSVDFSKLHIEERIGQGASGEVFKGHLHNMPVAVKRLFTQLDPKAVAEFRHEVEIMKELRHPNVVAFIGATPAYPFILVSEFCGRGTLYGLLNKPGFEIPLILRYRMISDVIRGMCYLHSLRPPIVHRDLKSLNLLVSDDMVVKVADFGLARILKPEDNKTMTMSGTAAWTAPEVMRGEHYNESCDVFSAGVVFWEIITRQPPWQGSTVLEVYSAVSKGQRLAIPTDCPADIAHMIRACWQEAVARPTFSDLMKMVPPEYRDFKARSLLSSTPGSASGPGPQAPQGASPAPMRRLTRPGSMVVGSASELQPRPKPAGAGQRGDAASWQENPAISPLSRPSGRMVSVAHHPESSRRPITSGVAAPGTSLPPPASPVSPSAGSVGGSAV